MNNVCRFCHKTVRQATSYHHAAMSERFSHDKCSREAREEFATTGLPGNNGQGFLDYIKVKYPRTK